MARKRRQPQRTCIGCRQVKGKREMLRIVRTPAGLIEIDPTGKKSGRGLYVCLSNDCLEAAIVEKHVSNAFRHPVSLEEVAELKKALKEYLAATV